MEAHLLEVVGNEFPVVLIERRPAASVAGVGGERSDGG